MKTTLTLFLMFFVLGLSAQPDGSIAHILKESEFKKCPYASAESYNVLPDKKGNLIASGLFYIHEEGLYDDRVIKFNEEGIIIAESKTGAMLPFYKVLLQEDNKVVYFTSTYENGVPYGKVVRLNEDLTVDKGFNSAADVRDIMPAVNGAGAIAIDKQNRIYVGGMKRLGPEPENERFIYRLLPDGSLDKDFQSALPTQVNTYTYGITVQNDGKILVAGVTTSNSSSIIRLNENGSLDEAFNVSLAGGNAFNMLIDHENRILVGGTFTDCNGQPAHKLTRLFQDGTTDIAFSTGSGFGDYHDYKIRNLWLHENGKIGVSGYIYQYKNDDIKEFAILNDDGSLWKSYKWNSVFDDLSSVYSMCKINDNELAVFGLFGSTYKIGQIGGGVIAGTTEQIFEDVSNNKAWLSNNTLELYSKESADYEIYSVTGKLVARGSLKDNKENLSVSDWPNALYIIYFYSKEVITSKKVVKN